MGNVRFKMMLGLVVVTVIIVGSYLATIEITDNDGLERAFIAQGGIPGSGECQLLPEQQCRACMAAIVDDLTSHMTALGVNPAVVLGRLTLACPAPVGPPTLECSDGSGAECPVPPTHPCCAYCGTCTSSIPA